MSRAIGIGNQDFEKVRVNNIFYIDKTNFIQEWWEAEDEVTLITRPRRFGKTLNMSMLEKFFSVNYSGRGSLFQGLNIWEYEAYREIQGTYPVLFVSFAGIKENSYAGVRESICRVIEEQYNKCDYLLEGTLLNEKEKAFYQKVSVEMSDSEAAASLRALSDFLGRYYGKKVIILLDEYDTPMQEAYVNGYWDEIILFNDTFYGPVYSWKEVFKKMAKEEVDFWGLSRHPGGGGRLMNGRVLPQHIQSYFLVCKRSLFLSSCWRRFWNALEYPKTYHEAVEKFEIYFSEYFTEKGYQSKAFSDRKNIDIAYGRDPCICCFYSLIKDGMFPIIKKKAVCLENLSKMKMIVDYIKKCSGYNIELIGLNMRRLCKEKRVNPLAPFNLAFLDQFYNQYQRVFIYGHGNYGKGIAEYFRYKGWKLDGFVVTCNAEKDPDVLVYKDIRFGSEDGIILALGEKAFYEVYPMVIKDLNTEQLCCPSCYQIGSVE